LTSFGILEKEDRKALLAAIKKANLVDYDLSKSTDAPAKLGDISSVGSSAVSSTLAKSKGTKVELLSIKCHSDTYIPRS
jgi:hypothetical protein